MVKVWVTSCNEPTRAQPGGAVRLVNSQIPETDRLICISDEQSRSSVPDPKGRAYMINVASAKNGIGYGPWLHVDGFSESIVSYITQSENTK